MEEVVYKKNEKLNIKI